MWGAVGLFVRFVMAGRLGSGRGGDFAKQSQFGTGRSWFVLASCDRGPPAVVILALQVILVIFPFHSCPPLVCRDCASAFSN